MDDVTPATRRMTYAELGEARGISTASAERLAKRRRWPRQVGNDRVARVLVPLGEDCVTPRRHGRTSSRTSSRDDTPKRHGATSSGTSPRDIGDVVGVAIREIVTPLLARLEAADRRHDEDRAEIASANRRADAERTRAERAELRVAELMRPWWRRWFRW
jgi:hypothetical protein